MLLDQAFLAGLGNYLRAEILWQAQLAPQHRPQDLTPEALQRLAQALLAVPRLSYHTRGQVNDDRHHGALFSFKVFHRSGEPCPRCGAMMKNDAVIAAVLFLSGLPALAQRKKRRPKGRRRAALCRVKRHYFSWDLKSRSA